MKNIFLTILSISLLTKCSIPEPDRPLRLKYEALQTLKKSGCIFLNPDTSLCGIKIRNSESAIELIGNKDKADSLGQYHYYSKMDRETLTLTQHPADRQFQISIFKVELSDKADYGYRELPIDTFKSEKVIKLGMTKKQIIDHLGTCYAAIDSMEEYIELYYRLETPLDSYTNLLKTNSMQIYYASYKIWKDNLWKFEFGFESHKK